MPIDYKDIPDDEELQLITRKLACGDVLMAWQSISRPEIILDFVGVTSLIENGEMRGTMQFQIPDVNNFEDAWKAFPSAAEQAFQKKQQEEAEKKRKESTALVTGQAAEATLRKMNMGRSPSRRN